MGKEYFGEISVQKKGGLRYSQRILFLREKTWKKKGIFWRNSSAQIIFHINSAKRKGWIMIKPKNIILEKKNFEKKEYFGEKLVHKEYFEARSEPRRRQY